MKKHHEHKIDELLRKSLGDLRSETTSRDWEIIKKGLEKEKPKTFRFFPGSFLILFALSVAAGIILFPELTRNTSENIPASQTYGSSNNSKLNRNLKNNTIANPDRESTDPELAEKKTQRTALNLNTLNQMDPGNNKTTHSHSRSRSKSSLRQIIERSFDAEVPQPVFNTLQKVFLSLCNFEEDYSISSFPKHIAFNASNSGKKKTGFFKNRLSLSANLSPEFNQLVLSAQPGSADYIHADYQAAVKSLPASGTGISGGLSLKYRLKSGFSTNIGFNYISFRQSSQYDYNIDRIPVIDSASRKILGYINNPDNRHIAYHQGFNTFNYVGIPLSICYAGNFTTRLGWSVNGGADLLIFTGADGKFLRPDNLQLADLKTINAFRSINYGLTVSAGFTWLLNNNIQLELAPSFHKVMNSLMDNSMHINDNVYSMGIKFGVNYNIY
jgi:hypothetical protein